MPRPNRIWSMWFLLLALGAGIFVLTMIDRQLEEQRERAALMALPEGWHVLLRAENVMSMAEKGDRIWAGGRRGVYEIDRQAAEVIRQVEFPWSVAYVTSVLVDDQGRLWVGYEDGVVVWDGSTFTHLTAPDTLPDNRVNTLYQDTSGRIWVGTWGGAAFHDGLDWNWITTEDGLAVNMVNVIMEDNVNCLWFGAYAVPSGAVSIRHDDGTWQYFTTEEGLPNDNVTAFLEVEPGVVWVGTGFYTRGGAALFAHSGDMWVLENIMEKEDGLAGEKVRSLYQDDQGSLWFGSEFDGVMIMRGDHRTILTEDDGLSHQEILSILQDADGDIWLGTLDGITKLGNEVIQELPRPPQGP